MEKNRLIAVTGGARSGKSTFAENVAADAITADGRLVYLATSNLTDEEMRSRISRHQQQRQQSKHEWQTIERSTAISSIAEKLESADVVLLDCLTVWLTNELFQENTDPDMLIEFMMREINVIQQRVKFLVVVSNDVLQEPIADNHLVQTYSRLIGHLHRQLIKKADQAYLVESGVPILMKGE